MKWLYPISGRAAGLTRRRDRLLPGRDRQDGLDSTGRRTRPGDGIGHFPDPGANFLERSGVGQPRDHVAGGPFGRVPDAQILGKHRLGISRRHARRRPEHRPDRAHRFSAGQQVDQRKGINVLEMAARLSGDYFCSETIPLHNGINLVEAVMDLSLGLPISPENLTPKFNNPLKKQQSIFASTVPMSLITISALERYPKPMNGVHQELPKR